MMILTGLLKHKKKKMNARPSVYGVSMKEIRTEKKSLV